MGQGSSTPLQACLTTAVGNNTSLLAFPSDPFYQLDAVKVYNLNDPVNPAAVTWPQTNEHVSAIIKCAASQNVKVQAKGGGHSYANYGLGGVDGAVVLDMKNFQQFSMDESTWQATIGAGMLLQNVTDSLYSAGGRAMAHGTCPQVGIGGHATIGGLGPTSRMWGSALDHVEAVEVVLANGTITTASWTENPDLFFGLKGAGASFGAITSFTVRTEPAPPSAVAYSFGIQLANYTSMAETLKNWQAFVSQPDLDRKFASIVTVFSFGLVVSGTYFGTEDEFNALNFGSVMPDGHNSTVVVLDNWLGIVGNWANNGFESLGGGIPASFYSKSMGFSPQTLPSNDTIDALFQYFDSADAGTLIWLVIFDLEGGAVSDVPVDQTAYVHRDTLYWLQSYAVNILGPISNTTTQFLAGMNNVIQSAQPDVDYGAYPGYVDPLMTNGQEQYWGSNLPKLEQVKAQVDPNQVFWNPQSVQPASE